jgi:hypothetical protein
MDVVNRAQAIYDQTLRQVLEANHSGEYVAIEPDSGDHFVASTLSSAIHAARAVHPARMAFAIRIGHPTTVDLGGVVPSGQFGLTLHSQGSLLSR